MANLSKQRRIASQVMDVGKGRVRFDPDALDDVAEAITREDIKKLIDEGTISATQKRGVSKGRARVTAQQKALGRRRGHGSRKGAQKARAARKKGWITKIRALRRRLKELRDAGSMDKTTYRALYNKACGGEFRSVGHLNDYLIAKELLTKQEGK